MTAALAIKGDEPEDQFGSFLAGLIARLQAETDRHDLPPITRIVFDGIPHVSNYCLRDEGPVYFDATSVGGIERQPITSKMAPLEFLHFQARTPIALYQYIAGVLFRTDFEMSRVGSSGVIDASRLAMFAVDGIDKERSEYHGKGAKRMVRVANVSDRRLDALKRLGAIAAKISDLSYWMLEKVVGDERPISEVAKIMRADERYAGPRFREALDEAAKYYRLAPRNVPRQDLERRPDGPPPVVQGRFVPGAWVQE